MTLVNLLKSSEFLNDLKGLKRTMHFLMKFNQFNLLNFKNFPRVTTWLF